MGVTNGRTIMGWRSPWAFMLFERVSISCLFVVKFRGFAGEGKILSMSMFLVSCILGVSVFIFFSPWSLLV